MTVDELLDELTGRDGDLEIVVEDENGWHHWLLESKLVGDRVVFTYGPERVNAEETEDEG